MTNEHSIDSPFGPDNLVRCFAHGLPAALKASSTTSNPDRNIYRCSVPSGDPRRCSFFYWQDELARTPSQQLVGTLGTPDNEGSMKQTITSLYRDKGSNAMDEDVDLTPSQKRMKTIEAALPQVNSPSASPNVDVRQTAGAPPSSYQTPLTPVKPSRASEDNVQFLSIEEFNTTTKGKFQALPQDHTSGEDEWDMVTPSPTNPPHRLQNFGRSLFPDESPSPTTVYKSTSKDPKAATPSGLSDWDTCTPVPALGEPYDLPNVSRKLGFNLLPSALSDDSTAEVFEELAQNAHLFNPRLGSVLKELPDFWRVYKKSERKRIASEKSVAAKSKRITTLNNEVAKLKAKIEELELEKLTH